MLSTSIVLYFDHQNFPVTYKSTGLAKDEKIAKWMFDYLGWKEGKDYPALFVEVERQEWLDSPFRPRDVNVLFSLGHPMIMN